MRAINTLNGPANANANASSNGEGAFLRRVNTGLEKVLLGEIPTKAHLKVVFHFNVTSWKGHEMPEKAPGHKVFDFYPGRVSGTNVKGEGPRYWLDASFLPVEIDKESKMPLFYNGELKFLPDEGVRMYLVKPGTPLSLEQAVKAASESKEFLERVAAGEDPTKVLTEITLRLQGNAQGEEEQADNRLLVDKLMQKSVAAGGKGAEPATFKCDIPEEVMEALASVVENLADSEEVKKKTIMVCLHFDKLGVSPSIGGKNGGKYPYKAGPLATQVYYPLEEGQTDPTPVHKIQFHWPEPVAVEIFPGRAMPRQSKYELPEPLALAILESSLKKNVKHTLDQEYVDQMTAMLAVGGKNRWPWHMGLLLDEENALLHKEVGKKALEWRQILNQVVGKARSPWGSRAVKDVVGGKLTQAEADALAKCVEEGDSLAWDALASESAPVTTTTTTTETAVAPAPVSAPVTTTTTETQVGEGDLYERVQAELYGNLGDPDEEEEDGINAILS